jgi:hypothetical protein
MLLSISPALDGPQGTVGVPSSWFPQSMSHSTSTMCRIQLKIRKRKSNNDSSLFTHERTYTMTTPALAPAASALSRAALVSRARLLPGGGGSGGSGGGGGGGGGSRQALGAAGSYLRHRGPPWTTTTLRDTKRRAQHRRRVAAPGAARACWSLEVSVCTSAFVAWPDQTPHDLSTSDSTFPSST